MCTANLLYKRKMPKISNNNLPITPIMLCCGFIVGLCSSVWATQNNKPDEDIASDQDKWLRFMQKGPRTSEPLYHTIADNSDIFTAAYNIIKASSFTDEEIRDLGLREKDRLENVPIAQDERDAGREEGRAEVRAEGRVEGIAAANLESAKTLLKTGELSIERISELFKIDINILKKLRDDGNT